MRLVADASDLDLLGFLATSRRRLVLATGASLAASLGWGLGVSRWIHDVSGSTAINLVLLVVQFLFVLLAGYIAAMLVASILFGPVWTDRVLLGNKPDLDDDDALLDEARFNDNTLPFYGLLIACGVAAYGVVWLATDDYIGRYNRHGYFAAEMRSEDPETRMNGARALVDPFHAGAADQPVVRSLLLASLDDPDPRVQMWAAWAAGRLRIPEARPGLLRILESSDDRALREAAHALGRLADVAGERQMVHRLSLSTDDNELRSLLTGLGFAASRTAAEGIAPVLHRLDGETRLIAMWALARGRTTTVRSAVMELPPPDALEDRCAFAEAYKQVTVVEDLPMLRALYRDTPVGLRCERVSRRDLSFHDDVVGDEIIYMPRETLRHKYVIAVFNVGGPGLEDWLEAVLYDEAEDLEVRLLAENLLKILSTSPARLPRE